MYDIKDAVGNMAKGLEQLAIAGAMAEDQIRALRIAGMETSATFEQLLGAFQGAVGARGLGRLEAGRNPATPFP